MNKVTILFMSMTIAVFGSLLLAKTEQVEDALDVVANSHDQGALICYADAAVVFGENGDYTFVATDKASIEKLKEAAKEAKLFSRNFNEPFAALTPATCYFGCEELDKADDPNTQTIGCAAYTCTLSKMAKAKYSFHLLVHPHSHH